MNDKDLLAWLESAITHAEELARAAADEEQDASWSDGGQYGEKVYTGGVASAAVVGPWGYLPDATRTYIAANDPASVLRRCAADRKLMAAHPITHDVITVKPDGTHEFGCTVCHYDYYVEGRGWCDTLLALAEGYGWTENER